MAFTFFTVLIIIFKCASVSGDATLTTRVSSSNSVRFLIMGDWGTQTSPSGNNNNNNKNNNNNNNNNKRMLSHSDGTYRDEEDTLSLLESKATFDKNDNGNGNNNNNNNNKQYWAVLVAKAMSTFADSYPADFLIALGDNFYNNGVTSTSDGLWTTLYTNVYNYDSLQIPWYAVFGNHDYGQNKNNVGSLDAQVEFNDGRWHAGYCYMLSYDIPNSNNYVDIVFVDTTLIAPQETYMTSTSSGISSNTQSERQLSQLECMEGYLAQSKASFLIVAGHYPMFSTGKNGPGDFDTTVELMMPYFETYGVDAYMCGHDHRLEHLEYKTASGGTMDFVISGAAGKPDEQLQNGITSSATSKFSSATGGFAFADVTSSGLTISFVDYSGAVLYSLYRQQVRAFSSAASGKEAEEAAQTAQDESRNQRYRSDEYMTVNSVTGAVLNELIEIGVLIGTLSSLVAIFILIASPEVRSAAIGKLTERFRAQSPGPLDPKPRSGGAPIAPFRSFNGPPKFPPVPPPPQSQMFRGPAMAGGGGSVVGGGLGRRPSMSTIGGDLRRESTSPAPRRDDVSVRSEVSNPVALSAAARAKLAIRGNESRTRSMPPPPPPPPAPATAKLNKHISAIRNLHDSMELQRPSHDAIAEAIAQTAKRLETLGLPTPEVPTGQGAGRRAAPASVYMRPLRDSPMRMPPSSNV